MIFSIITQKQLVSLGYDTKPKDDQNHRDNESNTECDDIRNHLDLHHEGKKCLLASMYF